MLKPKQANKQEKNTSKTIVRVQPTTKFIMESQNNTIPKKTEGIYGVHHLKVIGDSLFQFPITLFFKKTDKRMKR